jgi:hypothetical protein
MRISLPCSGSQRCRAFSKWCADSPVRVRAKTQDGTFELSIANSGNPIPQAAMERLFWPFVAVERSLGLEIARPWRHARRRFVAGRDAIHLPDAG